jgi:nonsense-mediated mRNA decay protein 3
MSHLKVHPDAKDVHIAIKPRLLDGRIISSVRVDAMVQGVDVSKDFDVEVRIKKRLCDRCSRIAGGYYEGIIQVRASERTLTEKERRASEKIAYGIIERAMDSDRKAFISKIKQLKEGVDIYVGTVKAGRRISKAIVDKFGGKFSESPKLVGRKDGKRIYRISFAVRIPKFVSLDIISWDDKVIQITGSRKKVTGVDLETGARFVSDADKLKGAELLCHKGDAEAATLTMVQDDIVQILDPHTYECLTVRRPPFLRAKPGEEVLVVKTRKGVFFVQRDT